MITIQYKGQELLSPKHDLVFKALYTSDGDLELLASLLTSILGLEICAGDMTITNSELVRQHVGDRSARIDVRIKLNDGKQINVEIQIEDDQDMERRSVYYLSRLYADQATPKKAFATFCPAIAINILDFNYFPGDEYHNCYRLRNVKSNAELTDVFEVNFIELPKAKASLEKTDPAGNGKAWDNVGQARGKLGIKELWLLFLAAKEEADLEMLKKQDPIIEKAVDRLIYVSADEQLRFELDMIHKAEMDSVSMIYNAEQRGRKEGHAQGHAEGREEEAIAIAKRMLRRNRPISEIVEDTGLTLVEVEALRGAVL